MADRENKVEESVAGAFYVDEACIDCYLCQETAPDNFARSEENGYSYVMGQPVNKEQEELCREAMEGCPADAIGDDG